MDNYGIPRRPPSKATEALEEYRRKRTGNAGLSQVRQTYVVGGDVFESKSAALRHVRRPFLRELTGDSDFTDWLLDHQPTVEDCLWASDEGMGQLAQLLLRIPGTSEQWAHWIVQNRSRLLRAYATGQRHELERHG